MTVNDRILRYLHSIAPDHATTGEIRDQAKVPSHQQVYMATQSMLRDGRIQGWRNGSEWEFWIDNDAGHDTTQPPTQIQTRSRQTMPTHVKSESQPDTGPAQFEHLAQQVMSQHYGTHLHKGYLSGVDKLFDMVSSDGQIVGDAKYYTLIGGERIPPAKFSVIAEYVWLMEKTAASRRFLVFGNDIRVPQEWLARYGNLVNNVEFYFLGANAQLDQLR